MINELRDERLRDSSLETKVTISFLEVYNENVKDLLAPIDCSTQNDETIKIRATRNGEIELTGLRRAEIKDFDEFRSVFISANRNRATGSTKMNSESSRSHSILTLYINKRKKADTSSTSSSSSSSSSNGWIETWSKLNLIDLAGSEDNRQTNTEAGSTVFKEATKINLSLTVLKVSNSNHVTQQRDPNT